MAKALKNTGHGIDWTYWLLMLLVALGVAIILATFVGGPIWALMGT
jgi:hypothetical protein